MTREEEFLAMARFLDNPLSATLFSLLMIWSLIWKGIALWKAARNSHMGWYVVLLVVNLMGILEIIYIFFFSKKKEQNQPPQ